MARKPKERIQLYNLSISDIASEGMAVAKTDDKVVFIPGGIPGDVVDVEIIKKKSSYMVGRPTVYHTKSALRTAPFCQHFNTCGGCKWQHLQYEQQLHYKQKQVVDALERIGKMPLPAIRAILPSQKTTFYRNKLEFTFSAKRWFFQEEMESTETLESRGVGFHLPGRFDKILDIQECHLQSDSSNAIRNGLKAFAIANHYSFYNLYEHTGLLRNLTIRTASSGDIMVILQFGENQPEAIAQTMDYLVKSHPEITSLYYVVNLKKNDTLYDQELVHHSGLTYIREQMEELEFRVGPKSFFQTNSLQAYELYKIVRELAGLSGIENVYDLYTGTGTIAQFLAKSAKQVVGIESVTMAIDDARKNASRNGIKNARFFSGDIKSVLDEAFLLKFGKPDVIITDPPRAGMHPKVVETLAASGAEKIVYVSCNPATQARDLALLSEKYTVAAIQPVDMFPHTYHVENVVLLQKKPSDTV